MSADEFHLGVETLGDTVIAGEWPHGGDFVSPGVQGFAELHQLRRAGLAQLVDGPQEARRQRFALFPGAVFVQQQVAESLFEAAEQLQRRMGGPDRRPAVPAGPR